MNDRELSDYIYRCCVKSCKVGVCASLLYDDVTIIPGKSRIFCFQQGFQISKVNIYFSKVNIKIPEIQSSLQIKCSTFTSVSVDAGCPTKHDS